MYLLMEMIRLVVARTTQVLVLGQVERAMRIQ